MAKSNAAGSARKVSRASATGAAPRRRHFLVLAAQAVMARFAATFEDFPAVRKPNTFTVDDALAKMGEAASGAAH